MIARFPLVKLLVLLAGLVVAGCASTKNADSPVGMEYSHGSLIAVEPFPAEQLWRPCRAALNALDITVLDSEESALGGYLDGRTPDLKAVMVKLRPLSANKTELRIRINSFGDHELAQLVYDKIQVVLQPEKPAPSSARP
jgi:hypothetical protein